MNQYAFLLTSYPIGSMRWDTMSAIVMLISWEGQTDPLSGLIIVFHDGSHPMGVMKHPFDEKVHGV